MTWVLLLIVGLVLMRFLMGGSMMGGGCGHGMMNRSYPRDQRGYGYDMAHGDHQPDQLGGSAASPDNGLKVAEFQVIGMSTQHCAETVSAALRGLPGVDDVVVNLKSRMAIVIYDQTQIDRETLKAKVSASGYELVDPLPEPPAGYGHGGHAGHMGRCC